MTRDDQKDKENGATDKTSLLVRVQRAVRSTARRAGDGSGGLIERVRDRVEQTIAPAIEDAARKALLKLAEPENAQKLQQTLAGFAQFAMKSGFRSDPNAALLFDFVDQLEKRHSRQQVLEVVVQHAMVYEQDLLAMLTEAIQSGRDISSLGGASRFDAFRDRASTRLLTLLCSLASLDAERPPPNSHHDRPGDNLADDEKVAYFEQAPIDARFKPLARMAAGQRDAFDHARGSKKGARSKTTALARFMPSLNDPATRFLTTSYLFFMQSYLVRAMIEELPEMLAMVRDLDQEVQAEQDDDVIEVGD
jgi:hypothetical protein